MAVSVGVELVLDGEAVVLDEEAGELKLWR
jgi:hypothetical protein